MWVVGFAGNLILSMLVVGFADNLILWVAGLKGNQIPWVVVGGGGGGGNKSAFKDPSIFFSGIALIRTQHMFLLTVDNHPCIIAMCSSGSS